jgi:putative sterol carrier protein
MAMAINGLYGISRGVIGFLLSTAMNEAIIDEVLTRFRKTMEMVLPIYEEIKPFQGFAGIIYTMFKPLNTNEKFAKISAKDNYSLLLVAKDDPHAIKITISTGKITFTPVENKKEVIEKESKACSGLIKTTRPTFLSLGVGRVKPLKAILSGRLKVKGIRFVRKFTRYFPLLRKN